MNRSDLPNRFSFITRLLLLLSGTDGSLETVSGDTGCSRPSSNAGAVPKRRLSSPILRGDRTEDASWCPASRILSCFSGFRWVDPHTAVRRGKFGTALRNPSLPCPERGQVSSRSDKIPSNLPPHRSPSVRSARGGHLFAATVRPTVELVLTTYPKSVRRKVDPEWGLPLLAP
jgi:hypothetical protein